MIEAAEALGLAVWHIFMMVWPILLLVVAVFAVLWVWEWSNGRHLPTSLREIADAVTGVGFDADDDPHHVTYVGPDTALHTGQVLDVLPAGASVQVHPFPLDDCPMCRGEEPEGGFFPLGTLEVGIVPAPDEEE